MNDGLTEHLPAAPFLFKVMLQQQALASPCTPEVGVLLTILLGYLPNDTQGMSA